MDDNTCIEHFVRFLTKERSLFLCPNCRKSHNSPRYSTFFILNKQKPGDPPSYSCEYCKEVFSLSYIRSKLGYDAPGSNSLDSK